MTSIYWGTTRNCSIAVAQKNNDITIRRGAKLSNVTISIKGSYNTLVIGHDVSLADGKITIDGENTHVRIGHRCQLSNAIIIAGGGEPVLIGDDCDFGEDSIVCNVSADGSGKAKPIFVPTGTQVGARSRIFKGTLIGEGATIPENSLVAGAIPGKHLTTWAPERVLKASRKDDPPPSSGRTKAP